MTISRWWIERAVLLVSACGLSGCTLVGYGIGALIDAGNRATVEPTQFASAPSRVGKSVHIRLRTGHELNGNLLGLERRPDAEYAESYERARRSLAEESPLPRLGDTVTVDLPAGGQIEAELLQWDYYGIAVKLRDRDEPRYLPVDSLYRLSGPRIGTMDTPTLRHLIAEGRVPLRTALAMELSREDGTTERELVHLERIIAIRWKPSGGRKAGLIVGGVLDAVMIIGVVACAASDCFSIGISN